MKIEYIYANPQMNRIFAHLANGEEVDYHLSILDVSSIIGEYKETLEVPKDGRIISLDDLIDIIHSMENKISFNERRAIWEQVMKHSKYVG